MNIKVYEYRNNSEFIKNVADQIVNGTCVIIKMKTDNGNSLNKMGFDMLEEARRYYQENDKINYIVTRGIVKKIIDVSLNREIERSDWLISNYGKPYIQKSNIKFNISHTRGCVLVTFSMQEVGVDVEFVDLGFEYKNILNDIFLSKEIIAIGNDVVTFYKYWVSKEARLKQTGLGITKLKKVEIIKDLGKSILLYDYIFREVKATVFFTPYRGYIACVSYL